MNRRAISLFLISIGLTLSACTDSDRSPVAARKPESPEQAAIAAASRETPGAQPKQISSGTNLQAEPGDIRDFLRKLDGAALKEMQQRLSRMETERSVPTAREYISGLFGIWLAQDFSRFSGPWRPQRLAGSELEAYLVTPPEPSKPFEHYAVFVNPRTRLVYMILGVHFSDAMHLASEAFQTESGLTGSRLGRGLETDDHVWMKNSQALVNKKPFEIDGAIAYMCYVIDFSVDASRRIVSEPGVPRERRRAGDRRRAAVSTSPSSPRAGSPEELYAKGRSFQFGEGVARDLERAAAYYKAAKDKGYPPAWTALGYFYQTGQGVPLEPETAFRLYSKAAEAGELNAAYLIALAYAHGHGVRPDNRESALWIARAAKGGHQRAQFTLGSLLAKGGVTPRNEFAAMRWFDKAARGDDPEIAEAARSFAAKLDDKLLFSGAARAEDVALFATVAIGLVVLAAATGDGAPPPPFEPPKIYDPADYDPFVAAGLVPPGSSGWNLIR